MRKIIALASILVLVLLAGCGQETEQSSQRETPPEVAAGAAQDTTPAEMAGPQDATAPEDMVAPEDTAGGDTDEEDDENQDIEINTD